ncbi:nuclear transport factor 2 family protein [Nocardia tengchongensis]|uniref:nuclear transport factor 2 family protein n=2 Tax=Nocardia tengchongensis TaxID=2055889 RepID=UPI0036D17A46
MASTIRFIADSPLAVRGLTIWAAAFPQRLNLPVYFRSPNLECMASADHITAVMHEYLDAINSGDNLAVLRLFAADATVEDPVGSETKSAHEFFAAPFPSRPRLELVSPVSATDDGSAAAMAFTLRMMWHGRPATIDVVDVMSFDRAGNIIQMRAHWGSTNITLSDADSITETGSTQPHETARTTM